jgi:hypothetical protein
MGRLVWAAVIALALAAGARAEDKHAGPDKLNRPAGE